MMVSSSARVFSFRFRLRKTFFRVDGLSTASRFRMSFFRLWAKPAKISLKKSGSLSSEIGQGWQVMCKIAESTFGFGLK